uniref:FAD_binding_7 domain-containing protein n=1 Tax=Heligmosomoides polygyrus TaxID=6339 RepID=A0A183FPU4_HELPZ
LHTMAKRDIKPNWEDLGWAWGKRSYPRRFLRSMQLVKKNPDWHDLGWTWGRRK